MDIIDHGKGKLRFILIKRRKTKCPVRVAGSYLTERGIPMKMIKHFPGINSISVSCSLLQSFNPDLVKFSYQFSTIFCLKILWSFIRIEVAFVIGRHLYPAHGVFGSYPENGYFILPHVLKIGSVLYFDPALG